MPLARSFAFARQFMRALLAVGAILATAHTASASDSFTPIGGGWTTYVNERFGTSFDFPQRLFTPGAQPANGDGLRFTAPNATLELYTWLNSGGETASSLKRRLSGTDGYTDVTYSPSGSNWLVISGFRADNIFYEKYFFRDGVVSGFGMEFAKSAKPRFAPIVERIEDSFRSGHAD